jgi:hypothetical protein
MKTPGHIVVGVDGSPSSLDALTWAVGQGALTGADVQAVIAWEYPPLSGVDPMTTTLTGAPGHSRPSTPPLAGPQGSTA